MVRKLMIATGCMLILATSALATTPDPGPGTQYPPTSGGSLSAVKDLKTCQDLANSACSPGIVTSLNYNQDLKSCDFRCGPKPAEPGIGGSPGGF